jgi:transposase
MRYSRFGERGTRGSKVVGPGELTDHAWATIAPLLPRRGRRSGQWRDHRTVINGILWRLRTGAPWRDLPERYGPWQTCADRLSRWRRVGLWDRLLTHVQSRSDALEEVVWEVSIDSSRARSPPCRWRPTSAQSDRRKKGSSTLPTRASDAAVEGCPPSFISPVMAADGRFPS